MKDFYLNLLAIFQVIKAQGKIIYKQRKLIEYLFKVSGNIEARDEVQLTDYDIKTEDGVNTVGGKSSEVCKIIASVNNILNETSKKQFGPPKNGTEAVADFSERLNVSWVSVDCDSDAAVDVQTEHMSEEIYVKDHLSTNMDIKRYQNRHDPSPVGSGHKTFIYHQTEVDLDHRAPVHDQNNAVYEQTGVSDIQNEAVDVHDHIAIDLEKNKVLIHQNGIFHDITKDAHEHNQGYKEIYEVHHEQNEVRSNEEKLNDFYNVIPNSTLVVQDEKQDEVDGVTNVVTSDYPNEEKFKNDDNDNNGDEDENDEDDDEDADDDEDDDDDWSSNSSYLTLTGLLITTTYNTDLYIHIYTYIT